MDRELQEEVLAEDSSSENEKGCEKARITRRRTEENSESHE